jgi:hypothetical protein
LLAAGHTKGDGVTISMDGNKYVCSHGTYISKDMCLFSSKKITSQMQQFSSLLS